MRSALGRACRAVRGLEPPMSPRPTMPILSKVAGAPEEGSGRPGWMTGSCVIADCGLRIADSIVDYTPWCTDSSLCVSNPQSSIHNPQSLRAPAASSHGLEADAAPDRRRDDPELPH